MKLNEDVRCHCAEGVVCKNVSTLKWSLSATLTSSDLSIVWISWYLVWKQTVVAGLFVHIPFANTYVTTMPFNGNQIVIFVANPYHIFRAPSQASDNLQQVMVHAWQLWFPSISAPTYIPTSIIGSHDRYIHSFSFLGWCNFGNTYKSPNWQRSQLMTSGLGF